MTKFFLKNDSSARLVPTLWPVTLVVLVLIVLYGFGYTPTGWQAGLILLYLYGLENFFRTYAQTWATPAKGGVALLFGGLMVVLHTAESQTYPVLVVVPAFFTVLGVIYLLGGAPRSGLTLAGVGATPVEIFRGMSPHEKTITRAAIGVVTTYSVYRTLNIFEPRSTETFKYTEHPDGRKEYECTKGWQVDKSFVSKVFKIKK